MGYEQRPQQAPLNQFSGLNTRDSELALTGGDSPFLLNVDLHPNGAIKSRQGCTLFGTPGGYKNVQSVMRLENPETGLGWIYCIANDTLYRTAYPGTVSWELPTGGTAMSKSVASASWGRANSRYYDGTTEYRAVLYIPTDGNAPNIALGQASATNDVVSMPVGVYGTGADDTGTSGYPTGASADDEHPAWGANHWPTHMRALSIGRASRMHAWGFTDNKSMVAYSAINQPWNFIRSNVDYPALSAVPEDDGGYYVVNGGDGDEVISVIDMFSYTVIFKKHSTYIFTGDPGSSDWTMRARFPVGCVSDRAWAKTGNDMMFWSKDGPRTLSAVQEYGDLAQSSISFKVSPLVKSIMPQSYARICAYHDVTNMRVVWFVALAGSVSNDAAYVYYYNEQKWSKWSGTMAEIIDVQVVHSVETQSEVILGGHYDEGLLTLQSGTVDVTDDIAHDYYTGWYSFGTISDANRVLWLDVMFGDTGTNVSIQYQTDLNEAWNDVSRITRSFGGEGTVWGRFAWGSAAWGVTGRAHQRFEIDALFDMIRFRFHSTNQLGFEVMGYRLEARQKGSRT